MRVYCLPALRCLVFLRNFNKLLDRSIIGHMIWFLARLGDLICCVDRSSRTFENSLEARYSAIKLSVDAV